MYVSPQLFLSKNLYIFENGVWGVAPSRVRAAAPHSPLSGERGQGDRDSKLEVYFKNRLFLQSESCDEMYVSPQLFLLSYNTI